MKLLDKTLLALLITSVIAIGASASLQYIFTKSKIESRVDKKLYKEKRLIKQQLKDLQPSIGFSFNTERSSVKFIDADISCKDSLYNGIKIDVDGEEIAYRILRTCIVLDESSFRVEIKKESEETATFVSSFFFTHFLILLVVVGIFALFKFFFLRNIWSPFFATLKMIQEHDIPNEKVKFDTTTKVKEFKELNTELQNLADRIYREYQTQKSYTEDATHELMTPIAVIRNKMELLIQSEQLKVTDLALIGDMLSKLDRIAKINKALILLSKIDHQYEEQEAVNLNKVIDESLNFFEDQIRNKGIAVRKNVTEDLIITMNDDLAHILLMNLLKNSVLHNIENGTIEISVLENVLTIKNSGLALESSSNSMFKRFAKESSNPDSIGLGLSIIQRVCRRYNVRLTYSVDKSTHTFQLAFPVS
ncbi:MAG: signal transduction histidine kinase [Parvicellaceae bacterium]|jgi:signal transduction histidine kinase